MKILHVASGDLWGGAESQLLFLVRAQIDLGDAVHVVLLNQGLLADRLRDERVPIAMYPESRLNTLSLLAGIYQQCAELRPDVVHTHRIKENVLGALAARFAGVPVCVRTAHGDAEHALKWYQLRKQVARFMERVLVFGLHDVTAAVSQELADKLQRRWLHGRIEVVRNGVDPDRIRRDAATGIQTLPTVPGAVRICMIGRLVPVKRVDLFLDACSDLTRLVDRPVHAFVIGDGPLRVNLEKRALGFPRLTCTFTGFVEKSAAWLRKMDLMVITSDHEGLPMSLLEAFALGVRVVSRPVGGITALLVDGRLGRLVDSDRSAQVAAAMAAELQRDVAGENEEAAAPAFPNELTAAAMAARYREIYLLTSKGNRQYPAAME